MARERESAARNVARDVAKRRSQESSHGGGGFGIMLPEGVNFFKNDGKTVAFDFIPYVVSDPRNPDVKTGRANIGDLVDARWYKQHRDIGADQRNYVCLASVGKPCPICEAHAKAKKEGRLSKDEVDALRARERLLYNVIDINDKDGKIMVWDVSYHLFTKQLEHEQEENNDYYSYWYPDGGYTLRIRFEKKTIGRSEPFWEADRIDFTKREPLSDRDLNSAVDLDVALEILPYEKLEKIFLMIDDETNEAPPAKEPPRSRPEESAREGRTDTGRRSEPEQSSRRGRSDPEPEKSRRADPAPETTGRSGRADTIHERNPENPEERGRHDREAGKHAIDPAQDCPGGGKFGVDESKLDYCDKCPDDKWRACRDEKDRLAKEAKNTKPSGRGR